MKHLAVLWILYIVQSFTVVAFVLAHIFSIFQIAGIIIYTVLVSG